MKKIVFVLSMMFLTFASYSQEFTFKRVFTQMPGVGSNLLKLQGSISVSDSLFIVKINGTEQKIDVVKIVSAVNTQQFKSKLNEDIDIRISLVPNPAPTKNEDYLITLETLDKFTNSNTSTMYYLTLVK